MIIEFAGERVRDPASLREAIERQPVGSTQEIKVLRAEQEIVLKVTLATREDPTLGSDDSDDDQEEDDE